MVKLFITIGIVGLVIISGSALIHEFLLSRVYPAPKEVFSNNIPNSIVISERIGKRVVSGVFLQGRKLSGEKESVKENLVVLFHGNGGTVNEMKPISDFLYKEGYSVLLVEYAGYGLSKRYRSGERRIKKDSRALIEYVCREYNFSNDSITLWGYSLGGAVAFSLFSEGIGAKLITTDTFTSMDDMVSTFIPKVFAKIINTEKYNNLEAAKSISVPTLVMHGDKDDFIPYEMAEKLAGQMPRARLVTIESNNHGKVLNHISDENRKEILRYLEQ